MRNFVRESRRKKGLTQKQLGKIAGLSQQMIAKAENGGEISVKSAKRIAAVLEIDWKIFFEDDLD